MTDYAPDQLISFLISPHQLIRTPLILIGLIPNQLANQPNQLIGKLIRTLKKLIRPYKKLLT